MAGIGIGDIGKKGSSHWLDFLASHPLVVKISLVVIAYRRCCTTEGAYFLYHNLVILVFIIFFCNWNTPYIKASAVGGHPGT